MHADLNALLQRSIAGVSLFSIPNSMRSSSAARFRVLRCLHVAWRFRVPLVSAVGATAQINPDWPRLREASHRRQTPEVEVRAPFRPSDFAEPGKRRVNCNLPPAVRRAWAAVRQNGSRQRWPGHVRFTYCFAVRRTWDTFSKAVPPWSTSPRRVPSGCVAPACWVYPFCARYR